MCVCCRGGGGQTHQRHCEAKTRVRDLPQCLPNPLFGPAYVLTYLLLSSLALPLCTDPAAHHPGQARRSSNFAPVDGGYIDMYVGICFCLAAVRVVFVGIESGERVRSLICGHGEGLCRADMSLTLVVMVVTCFSNPRCFWTVVLCAGFGF